MLRAAVRAANEGVRGFIETRPERDGMGGTVIATHLAGRSLHWISVGDSVLYLFRGDALSRLNADHSMAPQIDLMAANGAITAEEAASHPQRNCLTSAITGTAIAEVDCPDAPLDLNPDDILVLASDGLQTLPEPIIEALILRARHATSRDILRDLMEAVDTLNEPEQENTSIVVVRVLGARTKGRRGPIRAASDAIMKAFGRKPSLPAPAPALHRAGP